jgi:hypothetical protein
MSTPANVMMPGRAVHAYRLCARCGAVYATRQAFLALPPPPRGDRGDDGEGGVLIYRNCTGALPSGPGGKCMTTLAIPEKE